MLYYKNVWVLYPSPKKSMFLLLTWNIPCSVNHLHMLEGYTYPTLESSGIKMYLMIRKDVHELVSEKS